MPNALAATCRKSCTPAEGNPALAQPLGAVGRQPSDRAANSPSDTACPGFPEKPRGSSTEGPGP